MRTSYDFIETTNNTAVFVADDLSADLARFDSADGTNDVFIKIWTEFEFWLEQMPGWTDAAYVDGFSGLPHRVQIDVQYDDNGDSFLLVEYETV